MRRDDRKKIEFLDLMKLFLMGSEPVLGRLVTISKMVMGGDG
jgi:hypothetical protein